MDAGDALFLARAQFGLNIAFHILFPTITIALAWYLIGFRVKYARTQDPRWLATYRLWVKIFALTFAMGVVSGITMSFQFGTNWPGYMEKVGNIAGPLLAYEVLTAFFLEAVFLGIMLFGFSRVSNSDAGKASTNRRRRNRSKSATPCADCIFGFSITFMTVASWRRCGETAMPA